MRAAWKGDLSFGLLNISVKLVKGYDDNDPSFHLIHRGCNSRIRYKNFCESGHEVEKRDVARGLETIDGLVVFEPDEIKAIQISSNHTVELFRTGGMPDPALLDDVYWIEPELKSSHAANLLIAAMAELNCCIYGTITLRTREQTCVIWRRENGLAFSTLRYVDDMRLMPDIVPSAVDQQSVALAVDLLKVISKELPTTDRYRDAIIEAAASKTAGSAIVMAPTSVAPAIDIMEALRRSVAAAKKAKPKAARKQKAS